MNNLDKMKDLQLNLFSLVQFCHDNEDKLLKEFMSNVRVFDIDGIYFSGSKCVVLYFDRYAEPCNFYIRTSEVLEWVVEEGFEL